MDRHRRKFLRGAGLAGLSALLAAGEAAACWGRRRRVACARGYYVQAPGYSGQATGYYGQAPGYGGVPAVNQGQGSGFRAIVADDRSPTCASFPIIVQGAVIDPSKVYAPGQPGLPTTYPKSTDPPITLSVTGLTDLNNSKYIVTVQDANNPTSVLTFLPSTVGAITYSLSGGAITYSLPFTLSLYQSPMTTLNNTGILTFTLTYYYNSTLHCPFASNPQNPSSVKYA
jgi:hypothetical protein